MPDSSNPPTVNIDPADLGQGVDVQALAAVLLSAAFDAGYRTTFAESDWTAVAEKAIAVGAVVA